MIERREIIDNSQSSYRQIMKATSIFGGVQVFNIIIQIIRSKFVAIFLGPAGMGIMGLLMSTISIVSSATNFGLATSAVRDISEANGSGDDGKIKEIVSIFRKLVWFTGLLGMIVTVALSPLLSKLTFGNYEYTLAFVGVSVTLLFGQLSVGQTVLLQGLRKIKWLAKANLYSSIFSLLVSLPLYYFLGTQGIVPAIIVSAIMVFVVQYYFSNKLNISPGVASYKTALKKGKEMLRLGFMLSLSGLISIVVSYVIRVFISNIGGVEQVGFYNAGFTIINSYIGMVFAAMATDYYPRLVAIHHYPKQTNQLIAEQAEIATIILAPLIIAFLIFINFIIVLLYSNQFLAVTKMVHWAILGIFFKGVSWAMGYLLLAKGDSKVFFWNEFIANIYLLIFNALGYYYGGLEGLGISFLIGYIIHSIQLYLFTKIKYDFQLNLGFVKTFILYIVLGIISFLIAFYSKGLSLYLWGSAVLILTILISFWLLNRKMDMLNFIRSKIKK